MIAYTVRRLERTEWPLAFRVIHELRNHLSETDYLDRLGRMCERFEYELIAAFDSSGQIVGAMGMRPLETLARGWHMHIDDLVTSQSVQRRNVGTALLQYAEEVARNRGMSGLFLDSRPTAQGFYEKRGFVLHPPLVMKKTIQDRI